MLERLVAAGRATAPRGDLREIGPIGADLAGLVTYDDRLAAAAGRSRIEVWAPA